MKIVWLWMAVAGILLLAGRIDAASCDGVADREVRPLVQVEPAYPAEAGMFCVEGYARYTFTILPDGTVADARVLESVPEGAFDAAARIFEFWRFSPRCIDGEAVSRTATQQVDFALPPGMPHCDGGVPDAAVPLQIELVALMQRVHEALRAGRSPDIDEAPVLDPPYSAIEGAYRRFFVAQADLMVHEVHPWVRDADRVLGRAERVPDLDLRTHLETLDELRRVYETDVAEWSRLADAFDAELAEIAASGDIQPAVRRVFIDPMLDAGARDAELDRVMQPTLDLLAAERTLVEWLLAHAHEWGRADGVLRFASDRLEHDYLRLAEARDAAREQVRLQAAREEMMWSSG
jgi:TonB family protein